MVISNGNGQPFSDPRPSTRFLIIHPMTGHKRLMGGINLALDRIFPGEPANGLAKPCQEVVQAKNLSKGP